MTIITKRNMTTMTYDDSDYDDYDNMIDYDSDASEDDRPRISLYKKQTRAPAPINLSSIKKEKENEQKLKNEIEKEKIQKQKIETFRNTAHTGIWGMPGWMVQDIDVVNVMAAKQKLQDDLASGAIVIITKKPEPVVETPKIEKKENTRDQAFEVLSDKEKMKTEFEKTELCRSVTHGGVCPHGEANCRFLHDIALWTPRKCRFGDTCKCVKFISKSNGTFYVVNKANGSGKKVCMFIHGGESRDNFHARTKIPKPQVTGTTPAPTPAVLPKKSFVNVSGENDILKGKLNWLNSTPVTPVVAPTPTPVVSTPVVNWSEVKQQLRAEGISLIQKTATPKSDGEWITPKTKSQKREQKAVAAIPVAPRTGYMHQYTSLCRSVIQGVQCTHAVCRYEHNVEKIVLRKCGFEACRNVACVGHGVYRNTGRNVCNYLHQDESRDSYYKRLDIYKFKK